jgi:RimJ/RimL family protein N-acetyltransferase
VFEPLRTDRLVLRRPLLDDADALWRRRNEPEVAEYQAWPLPYPRQRADDVIESVAAEEGPRPGEWWMATVCTAVGEIVGDLALRLTWEGRSAEIGFTFARRHWGRGYAREAAAELVRWLFEENGVTRVHAMAHPDNHASTMLLERLGMRYEGRTRSSYWVGDECTDDVLYGMTRDDWTAWCKRPRTAPDGVRLVEITPATARSVTTIETHHSQLRFVAPVLQSFADALFPEPHEGSEVTPWLRAVEADGELAAFVMIALVEGHPPYLWRLSIDRMHQRRGIGDRILDLVIEQCRVWGAERLDVSWVEGRGSPRRFYVRRGFLPTGRIVDGETEATLSLA